MWKRDLKLGSILTGKWNQKHYRIIAKLGEGGIGTVYQVQELETGNIAALKISCDIHSITKEYDKLQSFQGLNITPYVGDLDDWESNGEKAHFFLMEYIQGCNLKEYIRNSVISRQTAIGIALIIGNVFRKFHQKGYVFGDLKLENLMIDEARGFIRIIDLGGVTAIGKGIKEFTPLYDRASWNMGIRRAEEGYDLFSLNMLLASLLLGEKMPGISNRIEKVTEALRQIDTPLALVQLVEKGLFQKRISIDRYLKQLKKIYEQNLAVDRKRRISIKDLRINLIFGSSILLFIFILWFSFGKLL
ncbi:protein kinase domain-containing protein [Geosporobacter ferrireducens]|nr:protein kinase [Geosporobacter ferrireducens]